MRDRHLPRLCRSCLAPMARQEDECWHCGAAWSKDARPSPSPSPRAGAAPRPVANGPAPAVVVDDRRATTQAQLAADRWADEGGSFDPDRNDVSAARPGGRSGSGQS